MNKKLLGSVLAAGAIYAGIGFLAFYEVTGRKANLSKIAINSFNKKHPMPGSEPKKVDERAEWFSNFEFEEYIITGTKGTPLRGYYIPAEQPSDKLILCSHGYRSSKGEFRNIAKFLHDGGYNVFLVDHQSSGKSEGDFITFGAYESKDLLLWVKFILDKFGKDIKIALYGISMGSASVMLTSNSDDLPENVKLIIADCGYTSVNEEFAYNLKSMMIPDKPVLFIANQFSKAVGKWDFNKVSPLESVKESKVPILFIHGEDDDFVPTEMVCRLYNACGNKKDLLTVPGAGHACSYEKNSEMYEEKLKEFFAEYFI